MEKNGEESNGTDEARSKRRELCKQLYQSNSLFFLPVFVEQRAEYIEFVCFKKIKSLHSANRHV